MDQIFHVIKKNGETLHGYGFATTLPMPDMIATYMKKSLLLSKFVHYFHHEATSIIKKANDNKIHIAPLIGDYFYETTPSEKQETIENNQFIKLITYLPELSQREKECVYLLIKGKSSRQIGEELNLSKRTVEHYIENIKNKWNCLSKQEVIETGVINYFNFL